MLERNVYTLAFSVFFFIMATYYITVKILWCVSFMLGPFPLSLS